MKHFFIILLLCLITTQAVSMWPTMDAYKFFKISNPTNHRPTNKKLIELEEFCAEKNITVNNTQIKKNTQSQKENS